MEPKFDALWMVLVLDKEKKTITVAAFDMSREKAEASARDRENPGAPMISLNIFDAKSFTNRLSVWLAENDIVGTENTETMRGIVASMKDMMKKIDKRHKRRKRPLR